MLCSLLGATGNARPEVMAQHSHLSSGAQTPLANWPQCHQCSRERECSPYPNLPSLATTPISLIDESSLQRSQNCLEKIQHVLCEEIREPPPTALRIQAHAGERGSVPPAHRDISILSLIRTSVKHKQLYTRVLPLHWGLVEGGDAVPFALIPEISPGCEPAAF